MDSGGPPRRRFLRHGRCQYPWGDRAPKRKLCNSLGNEGYTALVGTYSPQGDALYVCMDMSGDVWEWTAGASLTLTQGAVYYHRQTLERLAAIPRARGGDRGGHNVMTLRMRTWLRAQINRVIRKGAQAHALVPVAFGTGFVTSSPNWRAQDRSIC